MAHALAHSVILRPMGNVSTCYSGILTYLGLHTLLRGCHIPCTTSLTDYLLTRVSLLLHWCYLSQGTKRVECLISLSGSVWALESVLQSSAESPSQNDDNTTPGERSVNTCDKVIAFQFPALLNTSRFSPMIYKCGRPNAFAWKYFIVWTTNISSLVKDVKKVWNTVYKYIYESNYTYVQKFLVTKYHSLTFKGRNSIVNTNFLWVLYFGGSHGHCPHMDRVTSHFDSTGCWSRL
jgi:hypothetical protein